MSRVARHIASLAALGALIAATAADGRAQTEAATATDTHAQSVQGLPREGRGGDVKPNTRVGRPSVGKEEYIRYCVGCHGDRGDGMGDNTQCIDF